MERRSGNTFIMMMMMMVMMMPESDGMNGEATLTSTGDIVTGLQHGSEKC